MKSTVETLSPTRVRLAVEVPFDELKPSMDNAYKAIARQVRIPGFRAGKVPPAIIDQRVGRAAVLQEAVQEAVPTAYAEALRSNEVRALGQPEIELTSVDDTEGLAFTAEVDVRPDVTLPELGSIAVTVDDADVKDEEVVERIDVLRDRFAMLKNADRPAASGDYVSIDLTAELDGEELEQSSGMTYEVGGGEVLEGLDEALTGMAVDEEKTFDTTLAGGEHEGETAQVTVVLRSVKEKELPELDDDFAQTASEFDTIEELKADTASKLERLKKVEQGIQARDKVLDALLEAVDVPLPESVVEGEMNWRHQSTEQQLAQAGATLDQYLESQEQTHDDFHAELRTAAEKAVKSQLVLDALAENEQLGVSDQELTEHVMVQAERFGVAPEEYVQRMSESGNFPSLVAEVRRNKALMTVVEAAAITDESGNKVDIAALRRGETGEGGPAEDGAEETGAVAAE